MAAETSSYILSESRRTPRWSLWSAWWALFSAMIWLYVASASANAVGVPSTIVGMILATATYSIAAIVFQRFAARTGLSVELFSRSLFGKIGSIFAALIFGATALYYAVFEGSIIAIAFQSYFGGPIKLWYLLVVIYATPLAFGGVERWLDRLNGYLLPLYLLGMVAAIVVTATHRPVKRGWLTQSVQHVSGSLPGWLTSYLIYIGFLVLMMYTMDYARLGHRRDRGFHDVFTFGWVFYAATFVGNGLAGLYLMVAWKTTAAESGAAQALVGALGFIGVLVVLVSQTRINTANYFMASLNLEEFSWRAFRLSLPRWIWVLVTGALAFLLMLTNVVSYLLAALSWQGIFITAWVAIALTYIATNRGSGRLPEVDMESLPALSAGMFAWVLSSAVGLLLLEVGNPVWAQLSPIVTTVVAVAASLLLMESGHRPAMALVTGRPIPDALKDEPLQ